MISTLRKIPWYKAEHITIKQRHSVYDATLKMIVTLSTKVNRGDFKNNTETERLTPQLFGRLVTAAMLCPGFSVVQKHNIATVAGLPESKSREFNQPRFPDSWRHQWTLAPRPGMPIDVLEVCSRYSALALLTYCFESIVKANTSITAVVYCCHPSRDQPRRAELGHFSEEAP